MNFKREAGEKVNSLPEKRNDCKFQDVHASRKLYSLSGSKLFSLKFVLCECVNVCMIRQKKRYYIHTYNAQQDYNFVNFTSPPSLRLSTFDMPQPGLCTFPFSLPLWQFFHARTCAFAQKIEITNTWKYVTRKLKKRVFFILLFMQIADIKMMELSQISRVCFSKIVEFDWEENIFCICCDPNAKSLWNIILTFFVIF